VLDRIRTRLDRAFANMDDTTARLSQAATSWVPWPVLLGMCAGVGVWSLKNPSRLAQLDANKLTEPDRRWMLAGVVLSVAAVWLLYFLVALVRRRRTGTWRFLDTAGQLNRYLAPLLAFPLVTALRLPSIEKDSPKLTLFLAALAAAVVGAGVYSWGGGQPLPSDAGAEPDTRHAGDRLARVARVLAPVLVVALWAGYGLAFSYLAITNHHALNTRTTDLGYYDNIFYQSIHGRPLACTFIKAGYHGSAHFDPILFLLSPLYLLYPRAEMLLVLQSVWLGAGVVPVYLLAKEKLANRGYALALALAWALYPAMHGANMYEFHSLTLISPLVVWLLYLYETGRNRLYWVALLALLLCREDVSLLMCFVGLHALLDERPGKTRIGWLTIVVSVLYFGVVKAFFMTSAGIFMSGKDAYSFAYYYEDLMPNRSGLGGLVLSLLTNPVFAIRTMLEEPKIIFFLQLFLPLAFIPLAARRGRWMLAYGVFFCLLASRDAVFSIAFQYSSVLFPVAFALTPTVLKRVEDGDGTLVALFRLNGRRLTRGLLVAALCASVLVSWKFGGLVENAVFRGGFSRVTRKLTPQQRDAYTWVSEQVAKIPPGAIVGATNKMGAHISNRKEAYFYPGERYGSIQYAFVDEGELKGKDLERHTAGVKQGEFVELGRLDKMGLFQRVRPPAPAPAKPPAAPAESAGAPSVAASAKLRGLTLKVDGGAPPAPSSTAEPQDEDPPPGP
jgi:uncharacterized membrane protein